LVAELTVVVLEPEYRRAGRHVDDVVAILTRQAGHVCLRHRLRGGDADRLIPLAVHLDEAPDRIAQAEEAYARGVAEDANRRGARRLGVGEEAAGSDLQPRNLPVD